MEAEAWPEHELTPVPVDLEELAEALEGDPLECGGILDLDTCEVWRSFVIEYLSESERLDFDEKISNGLRIDNLGSRAAFGDMRAFLDTVSDLRPAAALARALDARHPFRRFKDVLGRRPGMLAEFFAFADTRKIERAAAWLADKGYVSTSPGRILPPARPDSMTEP